MEVKVLIIGGGVTGTGLARDLSLRGIPCLLAEQRDINAGASGGNHGLLHSGARYVATDPISALECSQESRVLKRIAPHCIEDTGGLFVAVPGDDETYIADFPGACEEAGVSCRQLPPGEALELEPGLSKDLIAAFAVDDASINPFQLSLDNLSQAIDRGARYLSRHQVRSFHRTANGSISSALLQDTWTGSELSVHPEIVINAAGAWSGEVLGKAGLSLTMHYSKGTLAVTGNRLSGRVINRLRPPGDGDILVPGGTVSILGTTSIRLEDLATIRPTTEEVDTIVEQGAAVFPCLETTRYIRSYAGVRPLVMNGEETAGDRAVSRGYKLIDHADEGCPNLVTITGGKLTTYRLMAEKAADLVADKLGLTAVCQTSSQSLPSSPSGRWSEPGRSPRSWLQDDRSEDLVLCECEMVPKSHFQDILTALDSHEAGPGLHAIRLRSRLGKGACQGTFCSVRLSNFLVEEQRYSGPQALEEIKAFLTSRWIGQRPVLWDGQLIQAELAEALHCGLLGLELIPDGAGHAEP